MSIVVACSCGQSLSAKPELAGKRVKCPKCGSVLQIPQPAAPLAPLDAPDDPLGLGGFDEQQMGETLPQMPASQPLQSALPSYTAPKRKRDWGPIIRMGLIGGGVLLGVGVLVAGVLIAVSFLGGHRSPESVFEAAKSAVQEKDWEGFCECLTPESRDQLAGVLLFSAVMAKGFSGLAALGGPEKAQEAEEKLKPLMDVLAEHGLDEATLENMRSEGRMTPGRADNDRLQQVLAPVKNRNKFVADMMTVMQQVSDRSLPSPMGPDARLEDLEVGDDSATGYIVQTRNDKENRDKIAFKKVDGNWLIDPLGSRR